MRSAKVPIHAGSPGGGHLHSPAIHPPKNQYIATLHQ